jgi:hypothetical protein
MTKSLETVRICLVALSCLAGLPALAQESTPSETMAAYNALRAFVLDGGSASVSNLTLKRDRAEMNFTGTFYFTKPVMGRVTGAVFLGNGTFRAEPPQSSFERKHLFRMIKANVVESDFKTAILRFADDTYSEIGKATVSGAAPEEATKLAAEFNSRILKGTGANIAGRLMQSLVNGEPPGFFLAQFDKGKRDKFSFLFDPQGRIPSSTFGVNGGEKGLIFEHEYPFDFAEVWVAFYSLEDYARGRVQYSDVYDVIQIQHYAMNVDLRDPGARLGLTVRMDCRTKAEEVAAVPFTVSEVFNPYQSDVLKRFMRVKSAQVANGPQLEFWQEDWEYGFMVLLPKQFRRGDVFTLELELEGKFLFDWRTMYYPIGTSEWYPRHGYLQRSTFDLTFRHRKADLVTSIGKRVREELVPDSRNEMETQWKMERPVSFITFSVGRFERHVEMEEQLPVEFYSVSGSVLPIKEDFIVAELRNCLRYFNVLFGAYHYPKFGATFHPRGFGQGFPSMLMIPNTDRASKYTYAFIAHETAHQWWGNIVGWRSYRDQWLSEGFAEYSGILYTARRDKPKQALDLLDDMRWILRQPPQHNLGRETKQRLADIGPIILGHRLSSRKTPEGYFAMIYNKGGLVLRMLHFLFTNPATGDGGAFFTMMKDFVERQRDQEASTEEFVQVASEHFAKTPIAQKYGFRDLGWFFRQWVWDTPLPSYRLEYAIESLPDGKVNVKGTLHQENAPDDWVMPLPLVFRFGGDRVARGSVLAMGSKQPVNITLPMRPESVELDPEMWVLSEKTSTKKQ